MFNGVCTFLYVTGTLLKKPDHPFADDDSDVLVSMSLCGVFPLITS